MEFEKWIVIAAEVLRAGFCTRYCFVKEAANGWAIDGTGVNANSNHSTRKEIHDD
jgi:hypothetical protein